MAGVDGVASLREEPDVSQFVSHDPRYVVIEEPEYVPGSAALTESSSLYDPTDDSPQYDPGAFVAPAPAAVVHAPHQNERAYVAPAPQATEYPGGGYQATPARAMSSPPSTPAILIARISQRNQLFCSFGRYAEKCCFSGGPVSPGNQDDGLTQT
eukprot:TRINITY_DN3840_c0_g1_i5.p1 TRINITY_DN3840_c0_g1~~TRINITY_DN3840_c0_g1_i5.p1  ORF type:complete len:155 (+),score=5.17 TRINITY_DN3840_c0_g1_i5:126-590(+)